MPLYNSYLEAGIFTSHLLGMEKLASIDVLNTLLNFSRFLLHNLTEDVWNRSYMKCKTSQTTRLEKKSRFRHYIPCIQSFQPLFLPYWAPSLKHSRIVAIYRHARFCQRSFFHHNRRPILPWALHLHSLLHHFARNIYDGAKCISWSSQSLLVSYSRQDHINRLVRKKVSNVLRGDPYDIYCN